jgi:hypothetical protein
MTTALATTNGAQLAPIQLDDAIEQVLVAGDLSKLSPSQRVAYYHATCKSLGLNPLTKPFDYITLSGKLTFYAKRDCTDQLRRIHGVSVSFTSRERVDDVYVVTARATMPGGRSDESTGVVALGNARGENLANAMMKAETKAKRRVTLSIVGLGILDESEIDSVSDARRVVVDHETGEILEGVAVQAKATAKPAGKSARELADMIRAASSLEELQQVAKEVGIAVKAGSISKAERQEIGLLGAARKEALAVIRAASSLEELQQVAGAARKEALAVEKATASVPDIGPLENDAAEPEVES